MFFSETFRLLEHSLSAADDETLNNDPLEKKEITIKLSPKRGTLQPKLQPLTVYHGRINCPICFVIFDKRNIKKGNFQKLTDLCQFKKFPEAWEKGDHECAKINQMVDWQDFGEKWAHKACKRKFFFLRNNFLQVKCNLSAQINYPQKMIKNQ